MKSCSARPGTAAMSRRSKSCPAFRPPAPRPIDPSPSCPRKRVSRATDTAAPWTPACAGVTMMRDDISHPSEETPMAITTQTNRKKLLLPTTMSKSGWAIVEAREDVEGVSFVPTMPKAEFHQILEEASGICLGVQPFSDPELDAAPMLEVVSRIGVGYDAVDVPALDRKS